MNMVLVNYVSYYATQVRGFLRDLSPEVIEELTGGLEADLIEAMRESTPDSDSADITLKDLIARFGTPEVYANELRESAGIAATSPTVEASPKAKKVNGLRTAFAGLSAKFVSVEISPTVIKFCKDVQPAWWLLRAWVLYVVIVRAGGDTIQHIPRSLAYAWLFLGIFLASALLGIAMRKNPPQKIGRWLLIAANIVVILFIPSMQNLSDSEYARGWSDGEDQAYSNMAPSYVAESGLERIRESSIGQANPTQMTLGSSTNMYVYDAEGNFIPDARILNESGTSVDAALYPVRVDRRTGNVSMLNFRTDLYGREVYNVFPASFNRVNLESDACTVEDADYWIALMDGVMNEDWEEGDEYGVLQWSNLRAQFKYGPNPDVLYVGGDHNLSNSDDCAYGLKKQAVTASEAPRFEKLPALESVAAANAEATDVKGSDAKGSDAKNSDTKSSDAKDADSKDTGSKDADESGSKESATKSQSTEDLSAEDKEQLEQLQADLKKAEKNKDTDAVESLKKDIEDLTAQ
jgi:hypothetical protein